ncbi:MAG TPA: hypothetical protein VEQ42_06095, partial [Pyrinomonadaceae bacterium]|nr:hypothetical protein [Pyrinomonadaceae bacterium]
NFSAEVEFKISAEGLLSDFKPTTLSGSPFIDGGLQEALNVLGERRTFQSLAKLSQVNAVRLDVDATTAQLTVRCQAATKELADAMTPVLTAVVRDLLDSLGVTDLTAPDERLSVTADGQNVTAVLSMPRQQAAELMRARFAEPPPAPTQQP